MVTGRCSHGEKMGVWCGECAAMRREIQGIDPLDPQPLREPEPGTDAFKQLLRWFGL